MDGNEKNLWKDYDGHDRTAGEVWEKIVEGERHKGPLTNAREMLGDLKTLWRVVVSRGKTIEELGPQNNSLWAELGQSWYEVAELQKESDAQQGVLKELRELVKELRAEIDTLQRL